MTALFTSDNNISPDQVTMWQW